MVLLLLLLLLLRRAAWSVQWIKDRDKARRYMGLGRLDEVEV